MKKCPYCLAEIHEATIVCPFCDSDLMVTVPFRVVTNQNLREKAQKKNRVMLFVIVGFFITVVSTSFAVIILLLWNFY
jgi:hypothetical protein